MRKLRLFLTLTLAAVLPGCVERALVITSEPTGADITVNQQWKGKTPYVLPFKHYGVYDIWIEHPGYEENGKKVTFYPLHVGEPIKAPGYQYAGMDFVTEALLPTTLRDQHNLHYVLERVDKADDVSDVLARAQQLREASQARTRMRYERDARRGRASAGKPDDPSGEEIADGGRLQGDSPDWTTIDATPPLPSQVPIFTP